MRTPLPYAAAVASLALLTLSAPTGADAQTTGPDPRWHAWVGCWEPVTEPGAPESAEPIVCATALTGASALELATIHGGRVIARDTIDATGAPRSAIANNCEVIRTGAWSADARRVYLKAETMCPDAPVRTTHRLLTFSAFRSRIDIESVSAQGNAGVRATRYREILGNERAIPDEFVTLVESPDRMRHAARQLTGSPIAIADVIDASRQVDSLVVQAWIVAREQRFDVDARTLMMLADAGVPGAVTDVLVAASYPQRFAFTTESAELVEPYESPRGAGYAGVGAGTAGCTVSDRRYPARYAYSMCDDFALDLACSIGAPIGYGYDRACGSYSRYGYGYGYGYTGYTGYGGYPLPLYPGSYSRPVIVVRRDEPPHGKLVKGRGYTPDRGAPDRGGSDPLSEIRGTSRSGGGSGSGSSTGSTTTRQTESTGSSSGSSGTGRTAQRRVPPSP